MAAPTTQPTGVVATKTPPRELASVVLPSRVDAPATDAIVPEAATPDTPAAVVSIACPA